MQMDIPKDDRSQIWGGSYHFQRGSFLMQG